jgi:pSer/pThr/pTyr-binding forkhead associated (FHA) protein
MLNRKEAGNYKLKVINVGDAGNPLLLNLEYKLLSEEENVVDVHIGRSRSNVICLSDLSLSKVHAIISYYNGDGFYLKDEGSKHGTFLNSKKLKVNDSNTQGNLFKLSDGNVRKFIYYYIIKYINILVFNIFSFILFYIYIYIDHQIWSYYMRCFLRTSRICNFK